jgi:hypothetical protein
MKNTRPDGFYLLKTVPQSRKCDGLNLFQLLDGYTYIWHKPEHKLNLSKTSWFVPSSSKMPQLQYCVLYAESSLDLILKLREHDLDVLADQVLRDWM